MVTYWLWILCAEVAELNLDCAYLSDCRYTWPNLRQGYFCCQRKEGERCGKREEEGTLKEGFAELAAESVFLPWFEFAFDFSISAATLALDMWKGIWSTVADRQTFFYTHTHSNFHSQALTNMIFVLKAGVQTGELNLFLTFSATACVAGTVEAIWRLATKNGRLICTWCVY